MPRCRFSATMPLNRYPEDKKKVSNASILNLTTISANKASMNRGAFGKPWNKLRENGYVYEKNDAQWFRSTEFGDDQDRVLVKASGEPTYRLPDIAYHWDKSLRGFDLVADIFGPDHHATAPQVLMGAGALGIDHGLCAYRPPPDRHPDPGWRAAKNEYHGAASLSPWIELVDEVGADPIRYFMISRSGNSQIDFDMDLAVEQSDKNPVYYIQNAHVRCAGILRKWEAAGYDLDADKDADLSLLTHEKELAFLRKATELAEVLEKIAMTLEPHIVHLLRLRAGALCSIPLYEESRVLHPDVPEPLRLARLRFYKAAKQLFARVLDLMGMSAPEVM